MRLRIGQRNNRLQFYVGAEAQSGPLRSTVTTWTASDQEWAGFIPSFLTLRNYGAGEVPIGTREVQLRAPSDIDERYGFEVIRGPERGTKWRVRAVDRSNRHFVNVLVEPFTGDFA